MPIYIIPSKKDEATTTEAIMKRAGGEIIDPTTLYEMIKMYEPGSMQFIRLNDSLMTKFLRNVHELTPDSTLPTVVFNVPGHAQTPTWMSEAHAMAPVDWMTIEPALLKSGVTASNTEEAEARSLPNRRSTNADSANTNGTKKLKSMFSLTRDTDEVDEEETSLSKDGDEVSVSDPTKLSN